MKSNITKHVAVTNVSNLSDTSIIFEGIFFKVCRQQNII